MTVGEPDGKAVQARDELLARGGCIAVVGSVPRAAYRRFAQHRSTISIKQGLYALAGTARPDAWTDADSADRLGTVTLSTDQLSPVRSASAKQKGTVEIENFERDHIERFDDDTAFINRVDAKVREVVDICNVGDSNPPELTIYSLGVLVDEAGWDEMVCNIIDWRRELVEVGGTLFVHIDRPAHSPLFVENQELFDAYVELAEVEKRFSTGTDVVTKARWHIASLGQDSSAPVGVSGDWRPLDDYSVVDRREK